MTNSPFFLESNGTSVSMIPKNTNCIHRGKGEKGGGGGVEKGVRLCCLL